MAVTEIVEQTTAMCIVAGVLQALAAGTFIYVAFFQLLHEQLVPLDTSIGKVVGTLAGFVVMSLLLIVPVFV